MSSTTGLPPRAAGLKSSMPTSPPSVGLRAAAAYSSATLARMGMVAPWAVASWRVSLPSRLASSWVQASAG